jgi:hypothetical protein
MLNIFNIKRVSVCFNEKQNSEVQHFFQIYLEKCFWQAQYCWLTVFLDWQSICSDVVGFSAQTWHLDALVEVAIGIMLVLVVQIPVEHVKMPGL